MKKVDMSEAAEQLLVATGWLPVLLRTPRRDQERVSEAPDEQSGASYPAAAE